MAMGEFTILGIAGSLRRRSFNRGLLRVAVEVRPDGVQLPIFDLLDVPVYNADVEAGGDPPAVEQMKSAIAGADALLLAVPEYNWSIPGVLKNAIDWCSRPGPGGSASVLRHRPIALMGAGGTGGSSRSQLALRQALAPLEAYVLPGPPVFVFHAHEHFDGEGNVVDDQIRENVRVLLAALVDWASRVAGPTT